jgi:hypothetical protein
MPFGRLACLVRGGHRWETITDSGGSITWCARCGLQRHSRAVMPDLWHRIHANLGYEYTLHESPGADGTEKRAERPSSEHQS